MRSALGHGAAGHMRLERVGHTPEAEPSLVLALADVHLEANVGLPQLLAAL